MASWFDLKATCERLDLGAHYIGTPPAWLRSLVASAQERPIVLNCKGVGLERTVVLLRLDEFERLKAGQRAGA